MLYKLLKHCKMLVTGSLSPPPPCIFAHMRQKERTRTLAYYNIR